MTVTWGLVGNSHDASLAVWDNQTNQLVYCQKSNSPYHDKRLFNDMVDKYCYPEQIIWYEQPFLKSIRQLLSQQGWLFGENNIKRYLAERSIVNVPIKYVSHHLSHAAYGYYTQRHDNCAVICLDSIGEFETLTIWHGNNNRLHKVHSQRYPHSLGLFYSAMTQRILLVPQRDEYLVASLASQGDSSKLYRIICDEIINLQDTNTVTMRVNLHRGCLHWRPELNTVEDLNDIAAATQAVFEQALNKISKYAKKLTNCRHLALAGGGALNRKAVNLILDQWDTVHVPPNPGDPGSSVGCILSEKKIKINNINQVWV